jgi:hypothetical protein
MWSTHDEIHQDGHLETTQMDQPKPKLGESVLNRCFDLRLAPMGNSVFPIQHKDSLAGLQILPLTKNSDFWCHLKMWKLKM